jgi:ABC-type Fe3+/spermidine/putrescine transport system ATPase subunit
VGNVEYALRRRHLARAEAHRRALQALEQVGLESLGDRYPHQLSGGEQQRVGLARAVVARPGLLLFDEPLSNLDADLRERLRVQIATLVRDSGATVVYITHDQAEAFALADDIAVLHRGKVVQFATPEDVYARPATLFVARFTGAAGELPGSVVAVDGAHVIVQVQGLRLRARNSGDLAAGSSARVLVRPAGTRIVADDGLDESILRGTIIDVAYRGRGYDHVFRCDAGVLTGVFASSKWPRGANVGIGIDPDSCVAYATVADSAIDRLEGQTPQGVPTAETEVVDVAGTGLLAHEGG